MDTTGNFSASTEMRTTEFDDFPWPDAATDLPRDGAICVFAAEFSGRDRLVEKLGKNEAKRAVRRCVKRIEHVLHAYSGSFVRGNVEGVVAAIAAPGDAFLAAAKINEVVAGLPPVAGVNLTVRIGIRLEEDRWQHGDAEIVGSAIAISGRTDWQCIGVDAETAHRLPPRFRLLLRTAPGRGSNTVFEAGWRDVLDAEHGNTPVVEAPPMRLRVRLPDGSREWLLEPGQQAITMGRHSGNDIIIANARVSRHHGQIEWRPNGFVMIDRSLNGSYVAFDHRPGVPLKLDEAVLEGSGHIVCGYWEDKNTQAALTFELLPA